MEKCLSLANLRLNLPENTLWYITIRIQLPKSVIFVKNISILKLIFLIWAEIISAYGDMSFFSQPETQFTIEYFVVQHNSRQVT